jgi:cyclopropane-fatty-acyl-phospholipid synthase
MPRLLGPTASLLRRSLVTRLERMWAMDPRAAPLDLVLPDGEWVRLGQSPRSSQAPRGSSGAARTADGPPGGSALAEASVPRLRVHDDQLFLRLLLRGEMGGGESYVAGEWSTDDLPGVIRSFLRVTGARGFESPLTYLAQLPALVRHRRAANSVAGSERNIHAHYDLGNDFYRLFLDGETLAYSCALWPPRDGGGDVADTPVPAGAAGEAALAAAQRAKLEHLCGKLELSPRDHLLEIGCGWGGMAIHAAATRGCRVTAITVSREQHELARARVAAAGLTERVDIQYRDYRDLTGSFDKLVSIEMLEAVGYEYLPAYFATCGRALRPGGVMALQSITMPDDRFEAYRRRVDWMQTYIFPGSLIPSVAAIRAAVRGSGLTLEHLEDLGPHYAPTLRAWTQRFTEHLSEVRALGFDAPFQRTWLLYLAFSEAAFAERTLGDHQVVLRRS